MFGRQNSLIGKRVFTTPFIECHFSCILWPLTLLIFTSSSCVVNLKMQSACNGKGFRNSLRIGHFAWEGPRCPCSHASAGSFILRCGWVWIGSIPAPTSSYAMQGLSCVAWIYVYIVAVIAWHNFYVDTHNINLRTKTWSCHWPWGMGFFEGYSRDIHSKLLLYQVRMFDRTRVVQYTM